MATRVAVVTGANLGIGREPGANRGRGLETGRQLLERGLRVAFTGRDHEAVERALSKLEPARGTAIAVRMDLTDAATIRAAHRTITKQLGPVDVIVNNAAILL